MADGRKNNGGPRPNAGPKTKAEILGLAALIDSVWSIAAQKRVFKKLADDCQSTEFSVRHEARKLLLAYKFGKPKESLSLENPDGTNLLPTVINLNFTDSK